jgi:hypothetical protein
MSHHCHDEHTHAHGGGDDPHDHSDDITPALQHSLYQHICFDEITTMNEARYGSGREVVRKTWQERMSPEPEVASDVDEQLLINIPYVFSLFFLFSFFLFFSSDFFYFYFVCRFMVTWFGLNGWDGLDWGGYRWLCGRERVGWVSRQLIHDGGKNRFTGQVKLHSILLRTSDSDSAPKTLKVIINREDVDFGVAEETDGTQTFELSRTAEVQELPVVSTPSALAHSGKGEVDRRWCACVC